MKRLGIIICVVISIIIIVVVPIIMDWYIIGNNVPSNISNSEWVGFFGSYFGSILGAVVSLIGIVVTIRFTKTQIEITTSQFEEQKRLNNIPILDCEITSVYTGEDNQEDALDMNVEYTLDKSKTFRIITAEFNIYNIGLGASLELKFGMSVNGVSQDGVFWFTNRGVLRSQSSIYQKIKFYIPEKDEFHPSLLIYYKDILGNSYCKTMELLINFDDEQMIFTSINQDMGVLCTNIEKEKTYYVIKSNKIKKNK